MAIKNTIVLFSNQDVAATGAEFNVNPGGTYAFVAQGTFDGATVALHILGPNGTTYVAITGASFTAEGVMAVDLPSGARIRGLLSGGTNPEDIYASLSLIQ